MIITFLRTALRNILKNRVHSALNILGFSTGLACFALVSIWLNQQLQFDRMHKNAGRIFQVNSTVTDESSTWKEAVTPAPLAAAIQAELPEVQDVVRIDMSDAVVRAPEAQFVEDGIIATDPSFFRIFDFKLLKGNPVRVLAEPYTVVISESIAKKYFGDADPVNQSIRIFQYDPDGRGAEYKITGVIEDAPETSHLKYTMLISFTTVETAEPETLMQEGWLNHEYYIYALLKDGALPGSLERDLPALLKKYTAEEKVHRRYFLTPLTEIHFQTNIRDQIQPGVSRAYMLSFGTIAFIVLVFACINYVNLSTAYAVDRYRVVGIRKVLGSSRGQLMTHYIAEAWLLAILSMILSLGWMEIARPWFETILGSPLTGLYTVSTVLGLFLIASLVGVLSGLYPALVLTSLQPISVLRGKLSKGSSGQLVRKSLVLIQYSVTVLLIIGISTINRQLTFIGNKDLGFDKENLLVLPMNGSPEAIPGYSGFYDEMKSAPSIMSIARSNTMIGGGLDKERSIAENSAGNRVSININTVGIDHDYLDTYRMRLIAGRNFIPTNASDSSSVILNETATRSLGYREPQDAIGRYFRTGNRTGTIIGIVQDFHHASLHESIEPVALYLLRGYYSRISIRMVGDQHQNLKVIEKVWRKSFPSTVFDYAFANDRLQNSYRAEDRFMKLFFVFSTISIIIALLGLFALVSYTVERRTKEIGVRKVLGGSTLQISLLLSREFISLVVISCFISMPLGWYMMAEWLQNFAYRVTISLPMIVGPALLTALLAFGTLGIKTVRSARANPVDSLRTE